MTRDRGEYRAIYEVLFDGKDWCRLTPESRLTWVVLKGTLGAAGINVYPAAEHVLAARTGHPVEIVGMAMGELAEHDWVDREGAVIWLKRGLDFEPSMEPSNLNHRKFIERHIASLPRLAIVDRYRAAYPDWFPQSAVPSALANRSGGVPGGVPEPPAITNTSTSTSPSTSTSTSTVVGEAADWAADARQLTAALNRGMGDNPLIGEAHSPVHAAAGTQVAADWHAAGIPIAFAAAEVYRIARNFPASRRDRQIRALLYCDQAVRRAWENAQAPAPRGRKSQPTVERSRSPAKLPESA